MVFDVKVQKGCLVLKFTNYMDSSFHKKEFNHVTVALKNSSSPLVSPPPHYFSISRYANPPKNPRVLSISL